MLDHVVFQDVLYAHVHASLFLVLYALALHVHVALDNAFSLLALCAVLQDDLGAHVLSVLYLVLHVLHEPVVPDASAPIQHVDVVVHNAFYGHALAQDALDALDIQSDADEHDLFRTDVGAHILYGYHNVHQGSDLDIHILRLTVDSVLNQLAQPHNLQLRLQ